MKHLVLAALLAALAAPAHAKQPAEYQVTGDVVSVSDDLIVVKKGGKENFEIARTPDTKITGELKPGGKATIYYRMTATSAEAKAGSKDASKSKTK